MVPKESLQFNQVKCLNIRTCNVYTTRTQIPKYIYLLCAPLLVMLLNWVCSTLSRHKHEVARLGICYIDWYFSKAQCLGST